MHSSGLPGPSSARKSSRLALEKASHDGHWTSARFLELLPPEGAGLLERDEEVFMSKEALLELKLKGWSKEKTPKGDPKGNPPAKGGKKGKEARRNNRQPSFCHCSFDLIFLSKGH